MAKRRKYTKSAKWFARFEAAPKAGIKPKAKRKYTRRAGPPTMPDLESVRLGQAPIPFFPNARDENLRMVLEMFGKQLEETSQQRKMISALEANGRDFSAKVAALNDELDAACQQRDRAIESQKTYESPRPNDVEHFPSAPTRD